MEFYNFPVSLKRLRRNLVLRLSQPLLQPCAYRQLASVRVGSTLDGGEDIAQLTLRVALGAVHGLKLRDPLPGHWIDADVVFELPCIRPALSNVTFSRWSMKTGSHERYPHLLRRAAAGGRGPLAANAKGRAGETGVMSAGNGTGRPHIPFDEINRAALAQMLSLVREWFPLGMASGRPLRREIQ
jgi:hypothetical protein